MVTIYVIRPECDLPRNVSEGEENQAGKSQGEISGDFKK